MPRYTPYTLGAVTRMPMLGPRVGETVAVHMPEIPCLARQDRLVARSALFRGRLRLLGLAPFAWRGASTQKPHAWSQVEPLDRSPDTEHLAHAGQPTVRTPKNGMNTRIGTSRRLDIRAGGNSCRGSDHALGGRASGDAPRCGAGLSCRRAGSARWHVRAVPTVRLDARGGGNVGHGATTISRLFQWCRSEWG